MTIPNEHLSAYISEIDIVLETCVAEAKNYAKYRAIGESFSQNTDWLNTAQPPAISFFNGLGAMLDLALVMSVWKMMEKPAQGFRGPGEIDAGTMKQERRQHDEIRSLPRLVWLFSEAFTESYDNYAVKYSLRQQEIVEAFSLTDRDMSIYRSAIERRRDQLLDICSKVEDLVASTTHRKLDIIRNEGFAHSSVISRKFIKSGMDADEFDFPRSALFDFGDQAMQFALDFEAEWNQRAETPVKELIAQGVETGASFWLDMNAGLVRNN